MCMGTTAQQEEQKEGTARRTSQRIFLEAPKREGGGAANHHHAFQLTYFLCPTPFNIVNISNANKQKTIHRSTVVTETEEETNKS